MTQESNYSSLCVYSGLLVWSIYSRFRPRGRLQSVRALLGSLAQTDRIDSYSQHRNGTVLVENAFQLVLACFQALYLHTYVPVHYRVHICIRRTACTIMYINHVHTIHAHPPIYPAHTINMDELIIHMNVNEFMDATGGSYSLLY